MGRILTGKMFRGGQFTPEKRQQKDYVDQLAKVGRMGMAAATVAGKLPNPFRSRPDLSEAGLKGNEMLMRRAAAQRAEMAAGDRFAVAREMEQRRRASMADQVAAGRQRVQDLGGANLQTQEARQRGAGMGATVGEARERVQALRDRAELGTERMTGQTEPGVETTFGIVFENLRDPDKRAQMPQEALENFFQGVSAGGLKRQLLNEGADGEMVNAAQELAQRELSRRARGSARMAEEIVDEQTGVIAPDEVDRFDETIVELDPVYRGLVGLSRDQARSKILVAARVADTKEAQDVLRKQWEILDAPRETIADLFKSQEQVQREHRAELEDRFAKLRKPEKGISAKDQADIDLKNERMLNLRAEREKKYGNKGIRKKAGGKGGVSEYDKLLKENIDDISKSMPEVAAEKARLNALVKAQETNDPALYPEGVTEQNIGSMILKARSRVKRLNEAQLRYRQQMKKFRARLRSPKTDKKQVIREIDEYLQSEPYLNDVQRVMSPGGVRQSKVAEGVDAFPGRG